MPHPVPGHGSKQAAMPQKPLTPGKKPRPAPSEASRPDPSRCHGAEDHTETTAHRPRSAPGASRQGAPLRLWIGSPACLQASMPPLRFVKASGCPPSATPRPVPSRLRLPRLWQSQNQWSSGREVRPAGRGECCGLPGIDPLLNSTGSRIVDASLIGRSELVGQPGAVGFLGGHGSCGPRQLVVRGCGDEASAKLRGSPFLACQARRPPRRLAHLADVPALEQGAGSPEPSDCRSGQSTTTG